MLSLNLERSLEPRVSRLAQLLGIAERSELGKVVGRWPSILGFSTQSVEAHVAFFRRRGFDSAAITRAIRRQPQVPLPDLLPLHAPHAPLFPAFPFL